MRKILLASSAFGLLLFASVSCSKSNNSSSPSNARTVQNFSGYYIITAATVTVSGVPFDEYASWDACQKDNMIYLKSDLSAQFIDTGIVCVPPQSANGNWSLSSNTDSISVSGIPSFPQEVTGFITSWDGKKLILTGNETISMNTATVVLTLNKQ
jgi:hypothetical protein